MGVSLKKGQGVSLKKAENDLSQVTIGLGWDVAEEGGLLNRLLGKKPAEYDLDAVAFLTGPGVAVNLKTDIIFYNNMTHPSGAIWLTGDNRTGAGEGDDEQIIIKLDQLPDRYDKIVLVVQIYEGKKRNQNFSKIKNAFIRAMDKTNREMCRFDLSGGPSYADCRSMIFAELIRQGTTAWEFKAIGKPFSSDSFVDLI